jgi:hypothetical protein
MKLPKVLIGVGGVSLTIFALWSVLAPAGDADAPHQRRTTIALADTPLVLRDGRQAVADVVRVAFEPQAVSLSEDAQEPLQEVLRRMADGCILSAQIVGAASEYETAPRPVIDAHLLALERADAIAQLVRKSGVPASAVASLWTVDSVQRVPDSVLWVFSSSGKTACVEPTPSFDLAAVPVDPIASAGPASALSVNPPTPRPQRDQPATDAAATADVQPAPSAAVAELVLTFDDNSSYLGESVIAKLLRFARRLPPDCGVLLRATVAGGADANYAAWLAERRMARVAEHLSGVAMVTSRIYVQNDASRQVLIAGSSKTGCVGATETASATSMRF